jgi:hypothetical protein
MFTNTLVFFQLQEDFPGQRFFIGRNRRIKLKRTNRKIAVGNWVEDKKKQNSCLYPGTLCCLVGRSMTRTFQTGQGFVKNRVLAHL